MGLFDFLFGRRGKDRDGSTPEKAVTVSSIAEEYQWMLQNHPDFRPGMQTLSEIAGKPFDVLTWHNDAGKKLTVYFDISPFYRG
jgi:hypothetical protein